MRDKPILLSERMLDERMLYKDCDHKGAVQKKNSLIMSLKGFAAKMN
jgi:hypothetical protein